MCILATDSQSIVLDFYRLLCLDHLFLRARLVRAREQSVQTNNSVKCYIKQNLNVSTDLSKSSIYEISRKSVRSESRCYMRMDGCDEASSPLAITLVTRLKPAYYRVIREET
jgi:hypothetical protein